MDTQLPLDTTVKHLNLQVHYTVTFSSPIWASCSTFAPLGMEKGDQKQQLPSPKFYEIDQILWSGHGLLP